MNILISSTNNLAIYEQIVRQIKEAIIIGNLSEGDVLPSIRSLAKDLQISIITTNRAYEELEKEGLIYSVAGKGFYISKQNTEMLREKKIQAIELTMLELVKECKRAEITKNNIFDMINVLWEEQG